MTKVIYAIGVSLDGYIADRDGGIDWTVPDEELHRFHNERFRGLGAELYGRRLYEVMRYWETAADNPDAPEVELEFAELWQRVPKVVFSRTLESVEGPARLATGSVAEEVAALKQQVDGDIGVGGAGLAASLAELDLIDEYHAFVSPVILGGGTPFLPPLEAKLELELVETRRFGGGVVLLRYRRTGGDRQPDQ
jgi:dihydrofolate reductase